jgi:phosphatidylserine decarboxylase
LDTEDGLLDSSVATPVLSLADHTGQELKLDDLDFSGSSIVGSKGDEAGSKTNTHLTEPTQQSLPPENSHSWSDDAEGDLSSPAPSPGSTSSQGTTSIEKKKARFRRTKKKTKGDDVPNTSDDTSSDSLERVINVKSCPLCHRPRLNSKAEIDIITHIAICASQDWKKVDRVVVGNFVTASQAQRKWYTKVISMVSSGDYKIGAVCSFCSSFFPVLKDPPYIQNSANIIVQN